MINTNTKYVHYGYRCGAVWVFLYPVQEEGITRDDYEEMSDAYLCSKADMTVDDILSARKTSVMIDTSICGRLAAEKYCDEFGDDDIASISQLTPDTTNDWIKKLLTDDDLVGADKTFRCCSGVVVPDEAVV